MLEETRLCDIISNNNVSLFKIEENNGIKNYIISTNNGKHEINARVFSFSFNFNNSCVYVNSHFFTDSHVVNFFNAVQKLDKEPILNEFIKNFDKSITKFKIIDGKPQCKSHEIYRKITEFGDGLRNYIGTICSLYACQNGYLFIDELDNGIYYEHFDRLWEIILTLSKEMNCQVFSTTHSKEMLESFARVAKKLGEEDVSYTTLVRNKNNELKAITRDYEMLMDSMEDGREVR